jgi:ABC-type polysaccharide/polyol phosphate transport system ATPase subunit
MSDPAIIAKDITVSFQTFADADRRRPWSRRREVATFKALDNVSLTIEQGEAFGVIGQNGAGKSTLLRVLGGTLKPDAGLVEYHVPDPTLLQLGLGFNPSLSGRMNVILGGLASGHSKATMEELYDQIVGFAELEHAIDRPVSTYSSGMRSRLAFSIALTLEPETLLLDELLTVGDAGFKAKSDDSVRKLLDRAGTIVLVSHSMNRIQKMCDRVLWLHKGKVRMVGETGEVVEAYLTEIGAPVDIPETKSADDWSGRDRGQIVLQLLSGEKIAEVSAVTGVPQAELKDWRRRFLKAGRQSLRSSRLVDDDDDDD